MFSIRKNIFQLLVLFVVLKVVYSLKPRISNGTAVRHAKIFGEKGGLDPSLAVVAAVGIASFSSCPTEAEIKTCTINVKKLPIEHSLILKPDDHTKFFYPDEEGYISLIAGESLFLSCPGNMNWFANYPTLQTTMAICVCGEFFKINTGNTVSFQSLVCAETPENVIVYKGTYGHSNQYRKYDIGFYTDRYYNFLRLIRVYFNSLTASPMYVQSELSKHIKGKQPWPKIDKKSMRVKFDQQYGCESLLDNMDAAYIPTVQDTSFSNQLTCHREKTCSYLKPSTRNILFNRGHLTPKSSFVYAAAGIATFRYVNTAPQWVDINGKNWEKIEDHVKYMAHILLRDLVVYTGVLDQLRLKDTANYHDTEKFIHLYDAGDVKALPIPLYFYKVVYEPISNRGIVYVTVNNPYIEDVTDYHICKHPFFELSEGILPKWNYIYLPHGYSYMCEVSDFMEFNLLLFEDHYNLNKLKDLLYITNAQVNQRNYDLLPRDK